MANGVVVNADSGEVEERPLTDEEETQRQADEQEAAEREAAEQAADDERAAAAEKLKTATSLADLRSALTTLLGIQ